MTPPRIRPRFRLHVPNASPSDTFNKIARQVETQHPDLQITAIGHHLVLQLPDHQQRYWSPQLTVEAEEHEKGGTRVRCLFAPKPTVWTFFVFLYSVSAFAALIGLITGCVQHSLNLAASGFWVIPPAALLFGLAYALALKGQHLSREQMDYLHQTLHDALTGMPFTEETS